VRSHIVYSRRGVKGSAWSATTMTFDVIDAIWSAMHGNEFYSPTDLANILGEPSYIVVRVLDFLAKYGFAERLTKREPIFRRLENQLGPGDALRVLRVLLGEAEADGVGRIANVSEAPERFRSFQ
jgi:hypothetical protein